MEGLDGGVAAGARNDSIGLTVIAGALAITILDGFDAFSLSLMAPPISRELAIPIASLGSIFATAMGGMIVGGAAGGALADKFGRLSVLMGAFILFGLGAATMPFVTDVTSIMANRFVAGIGLGAAAPLAVSLMNREGVRPNEFAVSLVWAGIPIGGGMAALFNYLVVADYGWRTIFWTGAALPVPIALLAWRVFRDNAAPLSAGGKETVPQVSSLFTGGRLGLSLATAAMFFFGYVTTSIVVNWLPTILTERRASPAVVSLAFGAMTAAGVIGTLMLGWLAARKPALAVRTWAWAAAGLGGLAASSAALGTPIIATLAIAAATLGAAAQALSVAFVNDAHRETGLEATSIGFMTGIGRLGQFSALALSGVVVAMSSDPIFVFALAAAAAGLAAVCSAVAQQRFAYVEGLGEMQA